MYGDVCDCSLCECKDLIGIDYPERDHETESTCGKCVLECVDEEEE